MRAKPLIAVTDVPASSRWYQRLLGLQSDHGGREYERLLSGGLLVLQLHAFGVGHDHGPIGDREDRPYGNGVLLWFEVDDFDDVIRRAGEMGVEIILPKHRNDPDHWECWMRDPDGYRIVVASPDWSASDIIA
jgi:catechol 2,3-dioxygenase-like lactoylglutathione lyase family enzyme